MYKLNNHKFVLLVNNCFNLKYNHKYLRYIKVKQNLMLLICFKNPEIFLYKLNNMLN